MKKLSMVAFGVLLCAGLAQGAVIVSDNFDDGVMDSQWEVYDVAANAPQETGGILNVAKSTTAPEGYTSVSSYTLTGDFDITVDVQGNGGNTSGRILFEVQGTTDPLYRLATRIQRQSDGTYESNTERQWGSANTYYSGNTGSFAQGDWTKLRMTRSGNTMDTFYWSGSAWVDAGNYDFSALTWGGGSDVSVSLYSAGSGATYGAFDNFNVVPEPATLGLLGIGGVLMLRRRRK